MPDIEFMTVAEVADFLRLSDQVIYNWISNGSLEHTLIDDRLSVRRKAVAALLGSSALPDRDDVLTVADVAELLKMNRQTIRNWL